MDGPLRITILAMLFLLSRIFRAFQAPRPPETVFAVAGTFGLSKTVLIPFSSLQAPDQFRYIQKILWLFKLCALNLVSLDKNRRAI